MTFTPEQTKKLDAPLDPKHIKPPPRGKFGSYIDGHHAISEANRIFGHGEWGYAITSLTQCSRVEAKDSNGNPQIRVGYRCTVRVDAGGVSREGAAVGSGMAKPENEHDAHESAVKEAETDALKRALRSFGNTFGLALYDKGDDAAIGAPPVELITDEQRDEIALMAQGAGVPLGRVCEAAKIDSLKDLPANKFTSVINKLKATMAKNAEKEPA